MRPVLFIISLALVLAAGVIVVVEPFHADDGDTVTYGDSEGACQVVFDGLYKQYALAGQEMYAPNIESSEGKVFLGWSASGGSYTLSSNDVSVGITPGQKIIVSGSATYKQVWLNTSYSSNGGTEPAQDLATSTGALNGTYSSSTSEVFDEFLLVHKAQYNDSVDTTITITDLTSGQSVKKTLDRKSGTSTAYGITVSLSESAIAVTGGITSGVYLVTLHEPTCNYKAEILIHLADPTSHNLRITTVVNGVSSYSTVPYGTLMRCSSPDSEEGTADLAWWYADFNDGSDPNNLPIYPAGTRYTATTDATFTAKMKGEGEGVVVYDLDNPTSYDIKRGQIYNVGGKLVLPSSDSVVKTGYRLGGWVSSSNPDRLYPCGYELTVDADYVVMTAQWIPSSETVYSVSFLDEDGSAYFIAPNIRAGTSIPSPESAPTVSGKTFSKWSNGTVSIDAGGTLTVSSTKSENKYTAVYTENQESEDQTDEDTYFTVVFDTVTSGTYTRVVKEGCTVSSIPSVDRAKCVLSGWKLSDGTFWNTSSPVTDNIRVKAVWTKVFDITFTDDVGRITISSDVTDYSSYSVSWGDGTSDGDSPLTHTYPASSSGTVTVTFSGGSLNGKSAWAIYQVGSSSGGTGGTSDETYTVRFLDSDGTVLQSSVYSSGETPVYSGTTPSSSHYGLLAFSGWDKEIAPVTQDTDYTAVYSLDCTVNSPMVVALCVAAVIAMIIAVRF